MHAPMACWNQGKCACSLCLISTDRSSAPSHRPLPDWSLVCPQPVCEKCTTHATAVVYAFEPRAFASVDCRGRVRRSVALLLRRSLGRCAWHLSVRASERRPAVQRRAPRAGASHGLAISAQINASRHHGSSADGRALPVQVGNVSIESKGDASARTARTRKICSSLGCDSESESEAGATRLQSTMDPPPSSI